MRISACRSRSELTTAPIVVRLRCSSISPSRDSRAVTISPSLPSVGSSVFPAGAAGDGDGSGLALVPGLADALGLALGDAAGEALGAGDPLAPAEPEAPGDADAPGDPDA